MPQAAEWRLLAVFITTVGCSSFNQLPFGIIGAPEHFQRYMNELIEGVPGVAAMLKMSLYLGEIGKNMTKNCMQCSESLKKKV